MNTSTPMNTATPLNTATPANTATPEATPVPTHDPAVVAMCKGTMTGLQSGNLKALEALSSEKRAVVTKTGKMMNVLKCLAIANNNSGYCSLLPTAQERNECLVASGLARDLKTTPKAQMKAQILYHGCLMNHHKAECDKFHAAVISHNPAACKGISKNTDRVFCMAMVSNDATPCKDISDAASRSTCAAFATDDASACSKAARPACSMLAEGFAAITKKGLAAFDLIDPTAAAASRDGKSACEPLLAELERRCIGD